MTTLSNSFEGTTSGLDISPTNSANGGDAFDTVVAGTGTTRVYDDTDKVKGTQCAKLATGATSAQVYLQWSRDSIGDVADFYERWFFKFSALPSGARYIHQWRDGETSETVARLQLNASGTITFTDTDGTPIFATTTAISANTWYRIETRIVPHTSTGQVELRLYANLDSSTATESLSSTASYNLGSTVCNRSQLGWISTGSNHPTYRIDEWKLSTDGWIGPAVTAVEAADAGTGVDDATPVITGTVDKTGSDTAAGVDSAAAAALVDDYVLRFGASALYAASGVTEADSFAAFYTDLAHDLDFYRATVDGIPTSYVASPLTVAAAHGLDAQLAVRSEWVTGARSADEWAAALTAFLVDVETNAPTMKVAFILNPEPEFETTALPSLDNYDTQAENVLLTAIDEAERYREHAAVMARAIWAYGNDHFTVCLAFSGRNSLRYVSSGDRIYDLQFLEFAEFGAIDWTADERAQVTVLASVYPKLDASGNISANLLDVDQRMDAQVPFWEYAELGYNRFGVSDFAYNNDLPGTSQEAKVRDAWRGVDAGSSPVTGSLGQWLRTTTYRIETFSARERSYKGATEPYGGPGVLGTLRQSATRMTGYRDLLTALRVTQAASDDSGQATDTAVVDITGTHPVSVADTATSDDQAVYTDG